MKANDFMQPQNSSFKDNNNINNQLQEKPNYIF